MMNDNFEQKIFAMAKQEKMVLPTHLENRIADILDNGEGTRRVKASFSWKKYMVSVAACVCLFSITVSASVGLYRQRMEAMNHEQLEEFFAQLDGSMAGADFYSRHFTESEQERMAQLKDAYETQGRFPAKELDLLASVDEYQRGVGFYAANSTFFFPEQEMTDEQLLQYIDFMAKREYSLAKINEEMGNGAYLYEKETEGNTISSTLNDEAIVNGDEAAVLAYRGTLSVQSVAVGNDMIYLGGYNRIEALKVGEAASEVFFEDLGEEDVLVSALYVDEEGGLLAGVSYVEMADEGIKHKKNEIWRLDTEGQLQEKFVVGEGESNVIDRIVTDSEGSIYVRMRRKPSGADSRVLIFDQEGRFCSFVQEGNVFISETAGMGVSEDGTVYVSIQSAEHQVGLAEIDKTGNMGMIYPAIQLEGDNYDFEMIAVGKDSQLLLWGYDGVYTYELGDEKAERIMAPYELPGGTEGAKVSMLQDGRLMIINATAGKPFVLKDGSEVWGKDPDATYIYWMPTIK